MARHVLPTAGGGGGADTGAVDSVDSRTGVVDLTDRYVRLTTRGAANGVATLDGAGLVPPAQLPESRYVLATTRGAANGVATLDADGLVPVDQLPEDYEPYDVRTFGAVGDGVADDTAAIQAACTAAAAAGRAVVAAGTFRITGTVTIKCHFDGTAAVFNHPGGEDSIAVQVGPGVNTAALRRLRIVLPRVVNTGKPVKGWTEGTQGVRVVNAHSCEITVQHVQGFESGLVVYGAGTGNVYTTYNLMHLDNNKRNIVLDADSGGWSNQNLFLNGCVSHNSSEVVTPGQGVVGVTHVRIEDATHVVNNNTWINTSFEGAIAQYAVDLEAGMYNVFLNCRWENAYGMRWGPGAQHNTILYGDEANILNVTYEDGQAYNSIITSRGGTRFLQGTGETVENSSSSTSAVLTVMEAAGIAAGHNPATQYRAKFTATGLAFKLAADTYNRCEVGYTGVKFGNGTVSPPITVNGTSSSLVIGGGPVVFSPDNTYDLGTSAALRPRSIHAGTDVVAGRCVRIPGGITAARPNPATVGVGAQWFDTTIRRPIWSDGTAWRDLLITDDPVSVVRATNVTALMTRVGSDETSRFLLYASGDMYWGTGSVAHDTNLYRSAADTLKTDDSFHIGATLRHLGSSLGFYNAAAVAKPTVSGSRGGNAALASLITALATLGLVTDSTTA